MKNVICSFANKPFVDALDRLSLQIKKISFFDKDFLFTEKDLDENFKNEFKDVLVEGVKGYGYWVWKPYLIKKVLDQLNNGDTLLYIDAGCHINYKGKKRLLKYFELLKTSNSGIIAFQLPTHQIKYGFFGKKLAIKDYYLVKKWTKGDLLDYFGVRDNLDIVNSAQFLAGIIMLRKSDISVKLIDAWCQVYKNDFNLVDDSQSKTANLDGFIQNRHDQSVFSILCKLHNVDILPSEEVEGVVAIVKNNPILAIRDIGGRMPYKSFKLLRLTRVLKSPFLLLNYLILSDPKFITKN